MLEFIKWRDEKYSVNIAEIDEQHNELVKIANEIFNSKIEKKDRKEVSSLLERLLNYTKYHFSTEEAFFIRYDYPETKSHHSEHNFFVAKISAFIKDFNEKKDNLTDKMLEFLKNWILKHILEKDKKYSIYFSSRGIDLSSEEDMLNQDKEEINADKDNKTEEIEEESGEDIELNNDKYNLKIEEIDNQHKELIKLLKISNKLISANITNEKRHNMMLNLLNKLYHYTRYHFSTEEELFDKVDYPHSTHHKEKHQFFVKKISEFIKEFAANKKSEKDVLKEVVLFLKNWTLDHILIEDKKYVKYLS